MQVDGGIVHGWSPRSCALERARVTVEQKPPCHEGDQPLHPICGNLAFWTGFPTRGGRVLGVDGEGSVHTTRRRGVGCPSGHGRSSCSLTVAPIATSKRRPRWTAENRQLVSRQAKPAISGGGREHVSSTSDAVGPASRQTIMPVGSCGWVEDRRRVRRCGLSVGFPLPLEVPH